MKKKSTVFDLHVPLWLIDEAMAACKKAAELEDGMEWRQCEVVVRAGNEPEAWCVIT